jgi:DNA-binding transcriptional MerR regulator
MELSIGELSQRAGVTRRTIRYYVEIGLLQPPAGAAKAAVYGADQLERLELIRELQAYRLSLEEIRDRLAGKTPGLEVAPATYEALAATEPPGREAFDASSAAEYIERLRHSGPIVSSPRRRQSTAVYRQASMLSDRKPPADYDAEQWLRVRVSEDVELHIRRRTSKTDRRLSRLIKEARRILAEEEVE